ncbi:ABI gene family member 3 isoform X4 [Columba livia]|uniref:ABI gene family member 3 isoform X4 n=1 Tax=Columba livia TaxID=8932 RepID=UPI0031B9B195
MYGHWWRGRLSPCVTDWCHSHCPQGWQEAELGSWLWHLRDQQHLGRDPGEPPELEQPSAAAVWCLSVWLCVLLWRWRKADAFGKQKEAPLPPCDPVGTRSSWSQSHSPQASDARRALEETMALSTQSLASVTYQVSSLASTFLRLLDLQAAELRQLEATVSCVAQKIVPPPSPPCLEPYYRRPLSFSILDDIGHGMKDHSTQLSRTGTLARRGTKVAAQAGGTLGRSARVPEPVQPPVVPEDKLSTASSSSSLASASSSVAPAAPTEDVPPRPGPLPPPVATIPPPPALPGDLSPPPPEDLPTPPPGDLPVSPLDLMSPAPDDLELPPPPALPDFEDVAPPPPPAAENPPWAPESYLEKVVALYPYTRQKDNELSFPPGALLFVTRRYSDGWCEGVMGEEAGFFPANYVEPF